MAAYWATHSVDATDPVLVRVWALSQMTPLDEEFGEVLVLPETAEDIEDTRVRADQLPDRPLRGGLHADL